LLPEIIREEITMPLMETIKGDATLNKESFEAHLIRTRDRIAFWRERVDKAITEGERSLILREITKLEDQLTEATQPRQGTDTQPSGKPFQEVTASLVSMVQRLQSEISSLKSQLLPQPKQVEQPDESVSESQAVAETIAAKD
jgi:phage shock protein A